MLFFLYLIFLLPPISSRYSFRILFLFLFLSLSPTPIIFTLKVCSHDFQWSSPVSGKLTPRTHRVNPIPTYLSPQWMITISSLSGRVHYPTCFIIFPLCTMHFLFQNLNLRHFHLVAQCIFFQKCPTHDSNEQIINTALHNPHCQENRTKPYTSPQPGEQNTVITSEAWTSELTNHNKKKGWGGRFPGFYIRWWHPIKKIALKTG